MFQQWLIIFVFLFCGLLSLLTYLNGILWKKTIIGKIPPSAVPWLWLIPSLFFIGISILLFFMWCMLGPSEEGGQVQAEIIVDALESYNEDHGFYPERLKDLSPAYVKRIPLQFQNDCTRYGNGIDGEKYVFEYVIRGTADDWNCYYPEIDDWMVWDSVCVPLEIIKENSP